MSPELLTLVEAEDERRTPLPLSTPSSLQFSPYRVFSREQWAKLRAYCQSRGVALMGDLPIFVAMDSSDSWTNPKEFFLDDEFQPTVVAGVPPDYFSATGQLWGNPLYRWDQLAEQGYRWWIERLDRKSVV